MHAISKSAPCSRRTRFSATVMTMIVPIVLCEKLSGFGLVKVFMDQNRATNAGF